MPAQLHVVSPMKFKVHAAQCVCEGWGTLHNPGGHGAFIHFVVPLCVQEVEELRRLREEVERESALLKEALVGDKYVQGGHLWWSSVLYLVYCSRQRFHRNLCEPSSLLNGKRIRH
jgi:hypothetical protein